MIIIIGNTKTSFIPTLKELHIAIDHATQEINMVSNVEQYLADSNINVKPGSPSHGLLLDSHPTLYEMSRIRNAEIIDKASQYIIYNNCHGYSYRNFYFINLIINKNYYLL